MREKITVSVVINKDRETVWQQWTEPTSISSWCHASDDWGVGAVSNDVQVGGRFSIEMKAQDGSDGFLWEGTYEQVAAPEFLSYVMGEGESARRVEVRFASLHDGQTEVREAFDPETENSDEIQRAGWRAILENFKQWVEGNK